MNLVSRLILALGVFFFSLGTIFGLGDPLPRMTTQWRITTIEPLPLEDQTSFLVQGVSDEKGPGVLSIILPPEQASQLEVGQTIFIHISER